LDNPINISPQISISGLQEDDRLETISFEEIEENKSLKLKKLGDFLDCNIEIEEWFSNLNENSELIDKISIPSYNHDIKEINSSLSLSLPLSQSGQIPSELLSHSFNKNNSEDLLCGEDMQESENCKGDDAEGREIENMKPDEEIRKEEHVERVVRSLMTSDIFKDPGLKGLDENNDLAWSADSNEEEEKDKIKQKKKNKEKLDKKKGKDGNGEEGKKEHMYQLKCLEKGKEVKEKNEGKKKRNKKKGLGIDPYEESALDQNSNTGIIKYCNMFICIIFIY
jgi:hypothetical protein